jgi:hypothetical protein
MASLMAMGVIARVVRIAQNMNGNKWRIMAWSL